MQIPLNVVDVVVSGMNDVKDKVTSSGLYMKASKYNIFC